MITGIGYCVGAIYKALIAWLVPDWRNFLRVLYSPALLFFFYLFLVDESPRWLLIKGKKSEAVKVIEKIAKKNKVKLEEKILDNITCETDNEENVKFSAVLKSTFSSRTLIQRFMICVVWWTTSTLVNYGMSITSVSLQGDKYANYALAAMAEVPGNFIAMYILMRYRRKYPLIASFLAAGVFCVGQPFLPTSKYMLYSNTILTTRKSYCNFIQIYTRKKSVGE